MNFNKLYKNYREKISFFFIGLLNTVFGYLIAIILLTSLKGYLEIFLISILASVISILFSFSTYKALHFKTNKKSFTKFFRFIIVYSLLLIFNAFFLTYFISNLNLNILLSQLIITFISAFILYILHNHFTFREF
jgi:putative flippase GtrA